MNDNELDHLLDKWTAPEPPPSLRARVRAAFPARKERRSWKWRLLAVCSVVPLIVIAHAVPATMNPVHPPYTVDSQFLDYRNPGPPKIEYAMSSYNDPGGREVVLSKWVPNDPVATVAIRMQEAIGSGLWGLVTSFHAAMGLPMPHGHETAAAAHGCAGESDRHETILGYDTVAIARGDSRRTTVWLAPGLNCFPLKSTIEQQQPDGTFRLMSQKQPLKVTVSN